MKNSKKVLIDVGSSTVKVYIAEQEDAVSLLFTQSITFKEGFDPEKGITKEKKKELFQLIKTVSEQYEGYAIKLYATALFRKIKNPAKQAFIDEFFEKTALYFNIIDHDLENFYLEVALVGKYWGDSPIMLVNIGGGSTELVIVDNGKAIERHNIDVGIGQILTKYKGINENHSNVPIDTVVSDIKELLPNITQTVDKAIYNGGELLYMQLVKYNLQNNTFFVDKSHPSLIHLNDFKEKNKEVFHTISLKELESLMPKDPRWMHGARICSAIAQAIFEKYNIQYIIPSNSNLIDGVIRQELRAVTLSGSFRKHLDYILKVKDELSQKEIQVLSPRFDNPKNPGAEFVIFNGEEGLSPLQLERHHLDSIDRSDALIVCSPNGYVGASALIEIGYAHAKGKRIIYTEKPEEFMLNTVPAEVGL